MLGFGKNMGILLLSITVILTAATFLTTQNLIESSSTNDVGFLMGHVTIKVLDENGFVKDYRQTDNVIVNSGWNTVAQNSFVNHDEFGEAELALGGTIPGTGGPFTHMGIGTVDTGLSGANADLAAPAIATIPGTLPCPRSIIEVGSDGASIGIGLDSSIEIFVFAEFDGASCEASDPINEAGIFNAATTGEMLARNTFIPVAALGSLDVLEIDWTFTFAGAIPGE